MTRSSKRWLVAAALFTVFNVGGAVVALAGGELAHAAGHVIALLGGYAAYLVWRAARGSREPRSREQDLPRAHPAMDQIDNIQQSVDAIALEVERIGEAQRFNARILAERAAAPGDEATR
jgi:hypothetical protein